MIKHNLFLKLSFLFVIVYWLLDSAVNFFIYDGLQFELLPSDTNELWVRCVIIFLLTTFSIFADLQTKKIAKKEQEKNEIYISMLNANQHILNNFLQAMMLFRSAADKSNDINEDVLALYDETIKNTITQINNLHGIQEPNKKTIEDRFLPKKT